MSPEVGAYWAAENAGHYFAGRPIYVLVHGYRSIFLENQAPGFDPLWKLWLVATVVFLLGHAWFYKLRKSFPDLL